MQAADFYELQKKLLDYRKKIFKRIFRYDIIISVLSLSRRLLEQMHSAIKLRRVV